jgi:rare lipoprotein A
MPRPAAPAIAFLAISIAVVTASGGDEENGLASWYGYPYHGRQAASGEIYNMDQFTAAHRTLPFGTRVRVVSLSNDKAVEVRINDRGPFIDGRIIDLSRAAARTLDLVQPGIMPVRLEVIDNPPGGEDGRFAVQVGAFREIANARRCVKAMRALYGTARMVPREGDPVLWRVLAGSESTIEAAHALALRIRSEAGAGFAVRLDPTDGGR